jgi:ferrous-iron efflux pump FieF
MKRPIAKATASPLDRRQIRLMHSAGAASVAVAVGLVALKSWAWFATDSVALLSSLADSLLDLLASLVTFFALRLAMEPADREHRFGHGKAEAVAGLVQSLIVGASAIYVCIQAIRRIADPLQIENPGVGIAVMSVSLVFTTALVAFQRYVVRHTQSLAVRADAVHYQADILTNIAVLVAIILSYRFGWYIADPLLGLVVVALILSSVREIAVGSIDVLLDRELPTSVRQAIREVVLSNSGIRGVHDIRTRSSGVAQFIQLHLELDADLSLGEAHEISEQVESDVKQRFPRAEVLIHVDPYGIAEPRDSF